MLSHIPNRPGEITLREMILAVKAISVLSWGEGGKQGPTNQAKALYIIVGNCTKCCRKVLNTRECRAKHNSK